MRLSVIGLALGIVAAASPAIAQNYPDKPVTLVVPYAAGGATDLVSRTLASKMQEILRQPVVVENKPGAGTMVAAAYVTRAPKDGYTLLMITASTVATAPHLYNSISYKVDDLTPISMVVKVPMVLAIKKDSPIKTINELIAYAKANPNALAYSTSGTGSTTHLAGLLFAKYAGIQLRDIPYRSSSQGLNDLLGGNIDLSVESVSLTAPLHNADKIRVLASFSDRRADSLPDVPTFKESGFDKVVTDTWFAVAAPAGTPVPIIQKLSATVQAAVADPETNKRLSSGGFFPESSTPEQLGMLIKTEYAQWGQLITEAGIPKLD